MGGCASRDEAEMTLWMLDPVEQPVNGNALDTVEDFLKIVSEVLGYSDTDSALLDLEFNNKLVLDKKLTLYELEVHPGAQFKVRGIEKVEAAKQQKRERDLCEIDSADRAARVAIFDRLWFVYDKDGNQFLDEAELKPLLIDCCGATAKHLEQAKQQAHQEIEEELHHMQEAMEKMKGKGKGGLLGGMLSAMSAAAADPSETYDKVIEALEEKKKQMEAMDASQIAAEFLKTADINSDGKIERSEFETGLAKYLPSEVSRSMKKVEGEIAAGMVKNLDKMSEIATDEGEAEAVEAEAESVAVVETPPGQSS